MSGVFNNFNDDTICAVATAMSDSGIGVIRVSGKDAKYILNEALKIKNSLETYHSLWIYQRSFRKKDH